MWQKLDFYLRDTSGFDTVWTRFNKNERHFLLHFRYRTMAITALQPWPVTDIVDRIHLPLVAKPITFGLCLLPNTISSEQCVFALSGNQSHERKTGSARRWWDSSLVGQIKGNIKSAHIKKNWQRPFSATHHLFLIWVTGGAGADPSSTP